MNPYTFRNMGYGSFGPQPPPPTAPKETVLEYRLAIAQNEIKRLTSRPKVVSVVLALDKNDEGKDIVIILTGGGQTAEVDRPFGYDVRPGMQVRVSMPGPDNAGGLAIVGVIKYGIGGNVATVVETVNDYEAVVMMAASPGSPEASVLTAERAEVGERLVLDGSGRVAVQNLGKPKKSVVAYSGETGVSWDDVAGAVEAKRALREAVEEPIQHKGVYARFGMRRSKGVLLWGPPGTGKTLLGKATATSIANMHGKGTGAFLYKKGPEILNMFVGKSEENVRALFAAARDHFEKTGVPAVVFLDEADSVLGKRGATRSIDGMERTVVPQFLAEMDGLDESGAFVIIATNRPGDIDPAVVREGRIDRKVEVPRPTKEVVADIVRMNLKHRPCDDVGRLSKKTADELFSETYALATVRWKGKDGKERASTFGLGDIVSGAVVAGVVDRATQHAIRRALGGEESSTVCIADIRAGLGEVRNEALATNLGNDLQDFARSLNATAIVSIDQIERGTALVEIIGDR